MPNFSKVRLDLTFNYEITTFKMNVKMYLNRILKAECPASFHLGDKKKDTSDQVILIFNCYYMWNFQEIVDIIPIF